LIIYYFISIGLSSTTTTSTTLNIINSINNIRKLNHFFFFYFKIIDNKQEKKKKMKTLYFTIVISLMTVFVNSLPMSVSLTSSTRIIPIPKTTTESTIKSLPTVYDPETGESCIVHTTSKTDECYIKFKEEQKLHPTTTTTSTTRIVQTSRTIIQLPPKPLPTVYDPETGETCVIMTSNETDECYRKRIELQKTKSLTTTTRTISTRRTITYPFTTSKALPTVYDPETGEYCVIQNSKDTDECFLKELELEKLHPTPTPTKITTSIKKTPPTKTVGTTAKTVPTIYDEETGKPCFINKSKESDPCFRKYLEQKNKPPKPNWYKQPKLKPVVYDDETDEYCVIENANFEDECFLLYIKKGPDSLV